MLLYSAKIVTMEGEDIPDGYVRIKDGKIDRVGPMEDRPAAVNGEESIHLEGRLLLPGFIDAHSHLGLLEEASGIEGDDLNEDTDPSAPHLRAIDGINPFDRYFAEARESGVTCAVISPGSANPVGGQVCALKTDGRWVDRMAVKEPLAVKFSLGENPKMTYSLKTQAPVTRMGTAAIIREQLGKAKRYLSDLERAQQNEDIDPPEYDAKCESLLPLLRGEIQAHFHAHKAYDILSAVRIAREFSLRPVIVHCTEGYLIADLLAEAGAGAICGPLLCARTKPELANQAMENCARLIEAGVMAAISTDHPEVPVGLLSSCASAAAANGLDRRAALAAITISAARVVGLQDRLGSIAPGKDADLLVFSDDPLAAWTKPDMVLINGKVL